MKKIILFCLIAIGLNCYSQITYMKGYFINNADEKTVCIINNIDWKNNPGSFSYKLTSSSETRDIGIDSVKEFAVDNTSKYIRDTVNIDRSSELVSKISTSMEPKFNEEVLFLKVIVEGKANLYLYADKSVRRFFYNVDSSEIEQLVYKKYKTSVAATHNTTKKVILKNNAFRQQLWDNLKCTSISIKELNNLDYRESELAKLFVKYNTCVGAEFVNYRNKQRRDVLNLSIRPGIKYSSFDMENSNSKNTYVDFGDQFGYRFGLEIEYILPFNKNKWGVIIEPTYQHFHAEKDVTKDPDNPYERKKYVELNYASIELPIGIRYYLFLSKKSKLFINGFLLYDFNLDATIDYNYRANLKIGGNNNLALGIGYKYNDRFNVEFRYHTTRDLLSRYLLWDSHYKTVSVVFGYTLFKK